MDEEQSKAFAYASNLLGVAIDVVGAAQIEITTRIQLPSA
jgi:hypothetical protein